MQKHHNKKNSRLWILLLFAVTLGLGFFGLYRLEKSEDSKRTDHLTDEPVERLTLEWNGNTYSFRSGLTSYLILGTDETTDSIFQYEDENLNNRQADFLMLMVVDRNRESCVALHLNRDTYMDIRRLDENGNPDGTVLAHLNNAHSFGSGGKDSCRNVAEAVSRLLYGVPVDHYMAVTMDGIPVLADLVGGIPVTLKEDLTELNPDYVRGKTVTLKGQDALRFARARMNVSDGTNLSRMSRQRDFMNSLYERLNTKVRESSDFALRLADALTPYLTSDMTTNELANLAEQLQEYRFEGIEDLAGEAKKNRETGYNDFLVDGDKLKEQLVRVFFTLR